MDGQRLPSISLLACFRHYMYSTCNCNNNITIINLDYFSYSGNDDGRVGVYVTANPLTPENNYYEVEILDTGMLGAIG